MLKPLLLATVLALSSTTAMAQMTPLAEMPSGKYTLDQSHASVTWKVSHLGLSNYTARFAKLDATLEFDAKDPTKSKLLATVDPASVRTDYPNAAEKDFDKKLAQDAEWFNAGKFPEIKFESTKVEKTGENTGKVHGNLTMLGVTKPLVLDAKFNGAYLKKPFADVPGLGFSATATLKRSDWGFSTYVPNIGDEVQILIETEFHKAQ
ncbi:MAG: YceI family protein [Rickettsiales bacterium]|jgi:polyisoprenoid-binding protein YceI|nr:YceI family protein [Rickettsiales bacterium]